MDDKTTSQNGNDGHDAANPAGGKGDRLFTLPVFLLVFQSVMLGTSEFIMVGVLPDIAADLDVPLTQVGSLVSLFAAVYAPLTPIGAAVAAKFERLHAQIAMLLVFLVGNILCTVASTYATLVVARVVVACVSGALVAVSLTFAPDVASERNRPRFISWVFSGFSVASVFGMPAGTWIAGMWGWRASFLIIDVLTVAMIVAMIVVLPHNSQPTSAGFWSQFKLFSDPRIIFGMLAVMFCLGGTYVWYTYITPMLTGVLAVPAGWVSLALVAYGLCGLWGNLHSGALAARGEGSWPMVKMGRVYILQAACMALLPLAALAFPAGAIVGAVLLAALGGMMYLQNSPSQVLFSHVAATRYPGSMTLASSLNSMACNIGIALGSAVGGVVHDSLGIAWLGPVGALFLVAAVLSALLLRRAAFAKGEKEDEKSDR